MDKTRPLEQPQPLPVGLSALSDDTSELPDKNAPVQEIFEKLETLEELIQFAQENLQFNRPGNPATFFATFRQDVADFQADNWKGPCNNWAEFSAHWVHMHGGHPYIVSVYPKGITDKFSKGWHQFMVCKTNDGSLTIFDQHANVDDPEQTGKYQALRWEGSLEEYLQKYHPNSTLTPRGGVVSWQLLRNNAIGKFYPHLGANEEIAATSVLPTKNEPAKETELVAHVKN